MTGVRSATAATLSVVCASMTGPLDGVRVVEVGVWVAGPAAAAILADWGADVVKIEPPQGDPARTFQRMLGGDMPSNPPFELDNRNKRSIVVDLATDEGRAVATQLVDGADVFVTNIRRSALARVGLDHERLLDRNPRLVYGLITGYGTEGPEADRPAHDIAAWGAAAVPARRHGRPHRGHDRGRHDQRRARRPGADRKGPARVDVALTS